METNTQNDIETDNNSGPPLPPPQFDAAMVSQAQQVEPLAARGRRKWAGPARNFFRGRLGVLAVILIALFLGAAALGMLLGLRDRQSSIDEPTTANQATPEPTNAGVAAPPVKALPVNAPPGKALARPQRAEIQEPEPKPINVPERVRRTVTVGLDDLDQALSQKSQRPRKVGEIFGGGRDARRGRKSDSRHREREPNNNE
jgi:hypothetical protein